MECPVCLGEFDSAFLSPLVFPCGHTLCLSCVNNIYAGLAKECPVDRHPLPDKSLIRPNYALLELLNKGLKGEEHLTCCNGHRIQDLLSVTGKCELCFKERNSLWFCITCQSGICSLCKDWFSASWVIRGSGAKCFNGHNLRFTENPAVFYKRNGKFLCDGCKIIVNGPSGHCRICSVDYCALCLERLDEILNQRLLITCKCGKQAVWRSGNVCGKCAICKENFEKSGSFRCIACKRKSCLVCTYKSS